MTREEKDALYELALLEAEQRDELIRAAAKHPTLVAVSVPSAKNMRLFAEVCEELEPLVDYPTVFIRMDEVTFKRRMDMRAKNDLKPRDGMAHLLYRLSKD